MLILALTLLSIVALVSLSFGVRYVHAHEFMPHHAAVARVSWSQLDSAMQALILGMLRIIGSGFLSFGLTLLWLLLPLSRNEQWASWAILSISTLMIAPTLYVTLALSRFEPEAKIPVVPTAMSYVLVVLAIAMVWLS